MAQNYFVIWIDRNIDEADDNFQNTLKRLRRIVSEVKIFKERAQCIQCLNDMNHEKAFVISSGAVCQHLVPQIHDMDNVDAICIFCDDKARHEQWATEWSKIKGVFTSIKPIFELLKTTNDQVDNDAISISYLPKQTIEKALDHLPASYMYSAIFKDIILEIDENDAKPLQNLIAYCRRNVPKNELGNLDYLNKLDYVQNEYHKRTAVWWYTDKKVFLYSMLNRSLRTLNMEVMAKMSFFIRHLHRQLEQLHRERLDKYKKSFIVYRGQGFSSEDFEQLRDAQGGLLSFNNFLSTSTKREIAEEFVKSALPKYKDNVGVLFVMTIDPDYVSTSKIPFAPIKEYSAFQEEDEILFSMHTVFRVGEIKQSTENNRLWEVQLILTDDNDPQLAGLIEYMKKEIGGKGWYRLGQLMLKMGHFDQAEILYNELLTNEPNDIDRANIYHQLGRVKWQQGQYKKEIELYEKSLRIYRQTLKEDDPALTPTYNNIALAYDHMGDYSKALEFYEKLHQIYENTLPPNYSNLATSYNNIAGIHDNMGDYSKALEFYDKSLEMTEKFLPPNHPDLASSYNNIAGVYNNMSDYSKALEFYEKDLEIKKKALPPDHPDLAVSYNNIGLVYNNMGDYSKALEFYEKSFNIREKVFSSNHAGLAVSHLNFAACYERMGDNSKALESLEKAFHIQRGTFDEGHLAYAYTFSRLGRVYRNMKDYTKALDYFEKCIVICEQPQLEKHPKRAETYSDIGDVHRLMGDYEKALIFHQKALNTEENVQCNPMERATMYVNLGETYREMKDYSMALTYFQKSLDIHEKKLPKNHPDLAVVYHNLSKLYLSTSKYSLAMKNVQQAIDIGQMKLPSTHPRLVDYRETVEEIRKKI